MTHRRSYQKTLTSLPSVQAYFAPWCLGVGLALLLTTIGSALGGMPVAVAQSVTDRIRTTGGSELGEISQMTRVELTIRKRPSGSATVAVNEIRSASFDDEPNELDRARTMARNGRYADAVKLLNEIDVSALQRDFIQQEVEFQKAYCSAMLALGGRGTINEAGTQLNNFVRAHPQNYHYWQAVELMGDLLASDGKFELAQTQYQSLAQAPWPDYQMRAAISVGRALQAQGKHREAIGQFDLALAVRGAGPEAENEKFAATLGKAISLAETDQLQTAVGMIEQVIADADAEQKELHARAYNALGRCYEKAGQTTDAILAYMHVDVLYNSVPEAHAEALARLVPLWRAIGEEARAREAKQTLEKRYAGSRWAK